MKSATYALMFSLAIFGAAAQTKAPAPKATLSRGSTKIVLYLPDATNGFYRGTRFDWSGFIADLQSQGHLYFGQWYTRIEPGIQDFIYQGSEIIGGPCTGMGPVDEFTEPLGYEQAKPGGTFIKIGVGVLRKPDDAKYDVFRLYEVMDSGNWQVTKKPASVEFAQEIHDPSSGYGYLYKKTVRRLENKAGIAIEHSLTNLGKRPIETEVYDHNFLTLDHQPPGPDVAITLPFRISSTVPPEDEALLQFQGNQILYRKVLTDHDRVYAILQGFGNSPADYNVRIENVHVGAGVEISGDRPIAKMAVWSIPAVLAVEPFLAISVNPGKTFTWKYEYVFYKLGPASHSPRPIKSKR